MIGSTGAHVLGQGGCGEPWGTGTLGMLGTKSLCMSTHRALVLRCGDTWGAGALILGYGAVGQWSVRPQAQGHVGSHVTWRTWDPWLGTPLSSSVPWSPCPPLIPLPSPSALLSLSVLLFLCLCFLQSFWIPLLSLLSPSCSFPDILGVSCTCPGSPDHVDAQSWAGAVSPGLLFPSMAPLLQEEPGKWTRGHTAPSLVARRGQQSGTMQSGPIYRVTLASQAEQGD